MPTKLTSICQPAQGDGQPAECWATFTVDGQHGNLKYLTAGIATLQADDPAACSYLWEVTSSPPHCDYILAGSTQQTAKLTLPGSGAYVVQLTVSKGECVARDRAILWVATPRRLYRIPADGEALRFDGDEDWAGDLARVVQEVDWSLPTPDQKAALDAANEPGPDNPFATREDLDGGPGPPCDLTDEEIAAIKAANEPSGENPFATLQDLPEGPVEPCELTDEQLAAIRGAEDPDGENPLITDSHRRRFAPTADQKAALDKAEEPDEDNSFVTDSHLGRVAPTTDQRKALDAADEPGPCNPFVTDSHLQNYVPTSGQREAMDRAEEPSSENPFVTESRLERDVLTPDQRAAIRRARAPTWENPFVTDSHLTEYSPTTDQRAALNHARCPTGENPYVTKSHLEELAPTPEQREALDGAQEPGADNPFITERALPEIPEPQLTDDQEAAIDAAESPNAKNEFVTRTHLERVAPTEPQKQAMERAEDPGESNEFVTRTHLERALPEIPEPQLTDDQEAAIDAAESPSAENEFVTRTHLERALPEIPEPQLTDDQEAAIDAAESPSAENEFVTKTHLERVAPTGPQKQAMDKAEEPGEDNEFVTKTHLERVAPTEPQKQAMDKAEDPGEDNEFVTKTHLERVAPTELQKQAMDEAEDPGENNEFITKTRLERVAPTEPQKQAMDKAEEPGEDNEFVTRTHLERVAPTEPQKQAMDGANDPSDQNPFATVADLGQAGVVTRTVAAGTVDLSILGSTSGNGLGGLEVVGLLPERGVATVRFDGYQRFRAARYVVKALPVRADAKVVSSPPADPLGFRQFIAVQLVAFNEQGFELQMIQPLHQISGVPALGPCMIEVAEIVTKGPEPVPVTLEQAIKRYYELLQKQDYAAAWPMLSEQFRTDRGLTFERYVHGWESSGAPILVGLHRCEVDSSRATLVLDLDFPSEGPAHERKTHLIRYDLLCDEDGGHPRFGYWLFAAGREVGLEDEIGEIWDRLTSDEREQLGHVKEPCAPEITAKFALQRFEQGLMYWFEHPASTRNIWVLFEPEADDMRGARWHRYVDDWPKEEEYSCDEARANGPNGPVRGFGWLWCKNAEVRQGVGDPVDREAGSGDDPPYSRGLFFEGGVIFFRPKLQDPVNTTNQGIVLFNGGGWRRLDLS